MKYEVDISADNFPVNELIEEIESNIEAKAIKGYHTEQHIEKMKPKIEEMKSKLADIRKFITGY